MIDPKTLVSTFQSRFGGEPRAFFAPGRVNLIGEHTDYNDGFVLPVALEVGITLLAAPRSDRRIRVHTVDLDDTDELDIDRPGPGKTSHWLDYIEGVAQALDAQQWLTGANIVLAGDVPVGAGLSSSAALEIATGFALLSLVGKTTGTIDRIALARAGQKAEHEYVGTRCGIMDQLVSARAAAKCALLIDCRSLRVEDVPLPAGGIAILVTDTRKKHELASSEYNRRREECEAAVEIIRGVLPEVRALRDVSVADLPRLAAVLPDVLFRRTRHVVTENARTLAVASDLERGDWKAAGAAFVESHRSLKNDYEVSAEELDHLVDAALGEPGVLGARMTGGGFGGSTVTLVEEKHLEALKDRLRASFAARFGHEPGFLVTHGGASARELDLAG